MEKIGFEKGKEYEIGECEYILKLETGWIYHFRFHSIELKQLISKTEYIEDITYRNEEVFWNMYKKKKKREKKTVGKPKRHGAPI